MGDLEQKTIDPETIRTLISNGAKIDRDRIDLLHLDGRLRVGIAGLTEPEQRSINGGLLSDGFSADAFEVAEDPIPGKEKRLSLEKLTDFLAGMHDAPDSQLDGLYAKRCVVFAKEEHGLEETLEFIRDTRDWCVWSSGASGAMMRLWGILLEDYPEADGVKKLRRAKLDAMVGN